MTRRSLGIGTALAAITLAAPLAAQSIDSDVRCLLASNVFVQRGQDPTKKQLFLAAQAFYLGRLDARISNDQLNTAMQAQAKVMTFGSLPATMKDCVKRLAQKGMALRAFGGPPPSAPPQPRNPK